MKLIGDEMLNSGEVNSTEFSDNTIKFNRLRPNTLSEVDLETANKNIIITPNDEHQIYFNDKATDDWNSWNLDYSTLDRNVISNSTGSEFNYIHFLSDNSRYFGIDEIALLNLDADSSFVIDWWMFNYDANTTGCLMYNGSTSSPNPIDNKELCITTSGDIVDPDTLEVANYPDNDGYLNVIYPPLKSENKINDSFWHHFALVAKDGQIQLIIDGKVNDQTLFEGINSVEDLLFGFGYSSGIEAYVGKIRITKGTDLGWFNGGFDLPDNDHVADGNTEFLMDSTSLVDTTTTHSVTVVGTALSVYQENHYVYLHPSDKYKLTTFNFSSEQTVYFPYLDENTVFNVVNNSTQNVIIKSFYDKLTDNFVIFPHIYTMQFHHADGVWLHTAGNSIITRQSELDSWKNHYNYLLDYDGDIADYGEYGEYHTHIPADIVLENNGAQHRFDTGRVIDCRNQTTQFSDVVNIQGDHAWDINYYVEFHFRFTSNPGATDYQMFNGTGAYTNLFYIYDVYHNTGSNYHELKFGMNLRYQPTAMWGYNYDGFRQYYTPGTYAGQFTERWYRVRLTYYCISTAIYCNMLIYRNADGANVLNRTHGVSYAGTFNNINLPNRLGRGPFLIKDFRTWYKTPSYNPPS